MGAPDAYRQAEATRRMNAAWCLANYAEALEETLTVHRLGVSGAQRKTLLTTNPVESAIEVVKHHARRVKRWNVTTMVLRWVGSGLVRAQLQFRRVKGHEEIQQLVSALENVSVSKGKDVA